MRPRSIHRRGRGRDNYIVDVAARDIDQQVRRWPDTRRGTEQAVLAGSRVMLVRRRVLLRIGPGIIELRQMNGMMSGMIRVGLHLELLPCRRSGTHGAVAGMSSMLARARQQLHGEAIRADLQRERQPGRGHEARRNQRSEDKGQQQQA